MQLLKKLAIVIGGLSWVMIGQVANAGPGDSPPPFALEGGTGSGGIEIREGVKPGQRFFLTPCVVAYDKPVTNIELRIDLPPEVEQLAPDPLTWSGTLTPPREIGLGLLWGARKRIDHCLAVSLRSTTDWALWSAPIRTHVRLSYEGVEYQKETRWSSQGFAYGCWIGSAGVYRGLTPGGCVDLPPWPGEGGGQ